MITDERSYTGVAGEIFCAALTFSSQTYKPLHLSPMKNSSFVERIIQSVFFKKAQGKAGSYARNTQRLAELLRAVTEKSSRLQGEAGTDPSFLDQVGTLIRMLWAFKRGEYKVIPWRSLLLIITALLYFVSPLDFIPDLLPIVGLTDDIALIFWVVKSLKEDIMHFRAWELEAATGAVEVP
jgi:uncharacterized membrane protein YkvA (DUF1232 family)